jgi:hypothetical protein
LTFHRDSGTRLFAVAGWGQVELEDFILQPRVPSRIRDDRRFRLEQERIRRTPTGAECKQKKGDEDGMFFHLDLWTFAV